MRLHEYLSQPGITFRATAKVLNINHSTLYNMYKTDKQNKINYQVKLNNQGEIILFTRVIYEETNDDCK